MPDIQYQRATLEELDGKWQDLLRQAYHANYNGMGESYAGISTAEDKINFMKPYLVGIPIWAAWDGDNLVGFLSGRISGDRLVLYDILIDPTFQRRGIARTLLKMAIEESGAHEVTAEVNRANSASQALFKSMAFECKVTSDWLVLKRP